MVDLATAHFWMAEASIRFAGAWCERKSSSIALHTLYLADCVAGFKPQAVVSVRLAESQVW